MWKPSKKALFFLILISATLGGVSFAYVDWEMVNNGENVFSEFLLPILFLVLSFNHIPAYVKKLKEEK
jgi:hypothetical protein